SVLCAIAAAQAPADTPPGRWRLETLTLKDGTKYGGLVQAESAAEIDFAEIVQPPGKPMYAVVRGVPRSDVERLQRFEEADHRELINRFAAFRHRAVIEAGRMEQVSLREAIRDAAAARQYEGPWFTLFCMADDEQTRRCVVRIEQMFRAYRT